MGLFDKLKGAIGLTGVEIDFLSLEKTLPITESEICATHTIIAKSNVTIEKITSSFYAKKGSDETADEIEIATEINSSDNSDNYPAQVKANEVFQDADGIYIIDIDILDSLSEWGINSFDDIEENDIKFFLKVEVDIKETVGAFDPSHEIEVTVINIEEEADELYESNDESEFSTEAIKLVLEYTKGMDLINCVNFAMDADFKEPEDYSNYGCKIDFLTEEKSSVKTKEDLEKWFILHNNQFVTKKMNEGDSLFFGFPPSYNFLEEEDIEVESENNSEVKITLSGNHNTDYKFTVSKESNGLIISGILAILPWGAGEQNLLEN
jgi:hypothetical protein